MAQRWKVFLVGKYGTICYLYMAVCQNLVPLVNIKIAGKWMFIPLKMVLIGIDPYPYREIDLSHVYQWKNMGQWKPIPSGKRLQFANWKIAIEIMDLPMKKKHSYVVVYQRVNDLYLGDTRCYRFHWHG